MIIAQQKPIQEIEAMVAGYQKILVVGCGTCVTVCMAGGEKEVGIMASCLRMSLRLAGKTPEIIEECIQRQCEWEFVDELKDKVARVEAIISSACGVGVQALVERFSNKPIYPALNTSFMGLPQEPGFWLETCRGCGNCGLGKFGGICPIARCSKTLLNGPCGGSQNGKCEIDKEMNCGWQLIYQRLKALGQINQIEEIVLPKDWSTDRDKGQRRIVREDVYSNSYNENQTLRNNTK
ncbi:methylenetetrahydrofolate reductase C-terminal domain-containing protein [bacterium]|nr:methylenetetrahydrofolate reductase C-terminal domain-containing protein [bacterium]